ncbi:serine hydrolase [Mucilaginibacter sp. L3T2-6]|uniref:serine hydrolase domain-containing protein n=1 Tax=Mucilaginibacter sp. L3T2-6 TaxID=3062491 RepID=UPI0026776446|nr:serine hydrolase domain-containing protein [Mucilaginibacter sp. L3T2-6]MDO3642967.1 serine hydrolase domain-containing protein [Mucilaginibacter sp. L3T2-6]MDV6215292.1 serine hydrolase domain-containing protein [Mucilaginibacter sp. L3T2-6]
MMNKKPFALLLPMFLFYSAFAQGPVLTPGNPAAEKFIPERLQRIDGLIKQYVDSGWIAGADALIARNGKIVYDKAFGLADIDKKAPMKTGEIFRIASQTKAITSVAVMTLFEEGKFLLDDPISKYIPSFAHPKVLASFNPKDSSYTTINVRREVTIRDLLTHNSGVDYAQIGSNSMKAIYAKNGIYAGFVSDKLRLGDAINKLGTLPLVHQPGEKFTYGMSIDVLGYLIEKLSGKSLDQFLRERIFQPLGMNDTYFYLPPSKYNRLATVYTPDKQYKYLIKWDKTTFPGVDFDYPLSNGTYYSGGAGLSSTTKDYAIFLQMMLNNGEYNGHRILSRHTVEMMTMNQIGNANLNAEGNKFGLGFEITTKSGQAKLGQTEGSFAWGGFFGTVYWADPEEKMVCLLYVQEWPYPHGELSDKFKALVYASLQ